MERTIMEDGINLHLLLNSLRGIDGHKVNTPRDIGENLFKKLLKKQCHSPEEDAWNASLYETPLTANPDLQRSLGDARNPLKLFGEQLFQLGSPMGGLRLPQEAVPELMKFLEAYGLNRQKIGELVSAAKDQDGFVHLDRVMRTLLNGKTGGEQLEFQRYIQPADITRLEEMLFKAGLGVGEVRAVMEKSKTGNGDVTVQGLSGALNSYLSNPLSEQDLAKLLEGMNVYVKTPLKNDTAVDTAIRGVMKDLSGVSPQDLQKMIKESIAGLLRERGVPPQEVKSFLETLSVDYIERLSTKDALGQKAGTIPADLLNKVVIRPGGKGWEDGQWQKGIIDILEKARFIDPGKIEEGREFGDGLRLNIKAVMNRLEQKLTISSTRAHVTGQEGSTIGEAVRGKTGTESKDAGSMKNPMGSAEKQVIETPFSGVRAEKEVTGTLQADQSRHSLNLPQPLPKILDRMVWMMQAGEQKGRFLISPPHLGHLDLDLVVRNGHLQANLNAENPTVKELIEANLGQLKQHLSDQGFVVERFEVTVGLDDRSFQNGDGRTANRKRGRHSVKQNLKVEDTAAAEAGPLRGAGRLYEIDVHV